MKHIKKIAAALITASVVLAGCSGGGANEVEHKAVEKSQRRLATAQPAPSANWSQLRQNLIDIEHAQIDTTATTTFFFNQGVQNPLKSCPSIGFPIASTNQLTNPEAPSLSGGGAGWNVLPQQETTGVYTGDSTGTYVICIDDAGKGRITYWEGFVQTETGEARWDVEQGRIVSVGASSATVNTDGER